MKKVIKPAALFCVGGSIYITIEILWRAMRGTDPTHWTMFILGGLCFLLIGAINEYFSWEMPFWLQSAIGAVVVLALEFIFGCVLNIWLGLNVWDYSDVRFNILGQVCLPFAFAWFFLAGVGIVLDDYLRYWLFGEEKPRYRM